MSPEAQHCLSDSVVASQGPGGFFYGRAGQEDLYYTFFGLLLAAVTSAKIRRKDCAVKLRSVDFAPLDLVHACAWLRAKLLLRQLAMPRFVKDFSIFPSMLRLLGQSNRQKLKSLSALPQHAYPQQDADSPYSRFLLGTLSTDFAQAVPEFHLDAYRLPNGLYANLKHHAEYGVNATAAALCLLPQHACGETADALLALQEPDGSFKAAASAPEGDLMSTATAAFALQRCGKTLQKPVKQFLRECFRENGFFAATPDDPDGDLEYTTYGLLLMGVIT